MKEDLSLIRDPGEREKATNEAAARIEKQSKDLANNIAKAQAEVEKKQKTAKSLFFSPYAQNNLAAAQDQLANLQEMRDELDKEAKSLRDLTSERTKSVESRKADNAARDKSDAFLKALRDEVELLKASKEEQLKIEAARNATPEDRGKAEALLTEREALKAKAEEQKKTEAEADAAAKKEEAALQRIAELEKKRVIDLEARRIELEKGREAAQAYRLEQEGLSKATAERLAAQEEVTRQSEESANKKNEVDTSPQAAVQGRLLTAGTGGDPFLQAAQKQVDAIKQLNNDFNRGLDKLYQAQKNRGFTVKTAVVP
jgi:hypothetical protein